MKGWRRVTIIWWIAFRLIGSDGKISWAYFDPHGLKPNISMSGPPIQSINIFSLRFGLWIRNSYYLLLYLDTSLKLNIPFFSGAMPVCILEQSTAARRNVVTATTLDQRRSLRANSLALLCQLLNFDFICAVEVFLAINNLQTIVIVLFNQIPKLYSQEESPGAQ